MKRPKPAFYILVVAVVLGPAAVRMAFWSKHSPQPIDPQMADAGKVLFTHEWKINDRLSPNGDGLGPVFNATSCVECHKQGGVGGGGELRHNVTTFIAQINDCPPKTIQGVIHARAIKPQYQETLVHVNSTLPPLSGAQLTLDKILPLRPPTKFGEAPQVNEQRLPIPFGVHISQRQTPALFGSRLIDALPDRVIVAQERTQQVRWGMSPSDTETLPVGRVFRLADGRVGKFGWKAQSASLIDFVEAACANELGLGNPGQAQPTPLGAPDYRPRGLDLTTQQCREISMFIASLPTPKLKLPSDPRDLNRVHNGQRLFNSVGCADCHTPNLGSVEGIYSDLLLHRMGEDLTGTGGYNSPPTPSFDSPGSGPLADEWRTPPLWGVADSAPYLHDGRAPTLEAAIRMHGGQAQRSALSFATLPPSDQNDIVNFLKSLRAP